MSISMAVALAFLVVLLVILAGKWSEKKRKDQIARSWKQVTDLFIRKESYQSLSRILSLDKKTATYDSFVDDQTWEDLNLQDIFEDIDVSYSSLGSEALFSRMHLLNFSDKKEEMDLQNFMREHPDIRLQVQVYFDQLGKQNVNLAKETILSFEAEPSKFYLYLFLGVLPVLSLLLSFLQPLLGVSLFLFSFTFNIIHYLTKKMKMEGRLEDLGYLVRMFMVANKMSKLDIPAKERLAKMVPPFKSVLPFSYIFRKRFILSETDFIFEYVNILFMLPFIAYSLLGRQLVLHRDKAEVIYSILADLEVAISLVHYQEQLPYYCLSTFSKEAGIVGTEIYHPLLENAVSNPLNFSENIMVSGDNASGKSTYIKTVAINAILAQSLGFACAKTFTMAKGHILTTMNVRDDILEGDSFFMAESKLIKRMLLGLNEKKMTYLFLDEIFRGTNSDERMSAGLAIIDWLQDKPCLYMMSTHDMELVARATSFNKNVHFQTTYKDKEIQFDYQVREGIARKTNAIQVLDYLQYPKEIVEKAEQYLDELQN